MGRRCCCLNQCEQFYQLSECNDNDCPEDGVFVSCAALNWLQSLGQSTYIICFSELCCLRYREGVTELAVFDELPTDGFPIYSETEGESGTTIQEYKQCVCSDCDVLEGACCYTFRGNRYCEELNKADCYSDHAGQDPEYWGDGTCCEVPSGDCTSDNPDSRQCADPDNEDCRLYVGVCYDTDGDETVCGDNGNASGCDSTVSIVIGFPQLGTYSGSGGAGSQACPAPPHNDCEELAGDSNHCCIDNIQASTAQCELEKRVATLERWESDGIVQGSALDQQWHKISTCLGTQCETHDDPKECNFCDHPVYAPCADGIVDWSCPCCGAVRHMDFLYSASVQSIGGCVPPCNTFQVDIHYYLGINSCLGGIDCSTNGGCCFDPDNEPNVICHGHTYGMRYHVTRPDCGCPVGLTSGDAHYVREISEGGVVQSDQTRCNQGCGCDNWIGTFWRVRVSEIIEGLTWTIS